MRGGILLTKVVNLFGGPGTGKSTTAWDLSAALKRRNVNVEYVPEYAKGMVWEERPGVFKNQIYMFAKQHHAITRVLGKVNVVVTDCPILLSLYYGKDMSPAFKELVLEEHRKMDTLDVFLKRVKPYNPAGRFQTESQAKKIDVHVRDILDQLEMPYEVVLGDGVAAQTICETLGVKW